MARGAQDPLGLGLPNLWAVRLARRLLRWLPGAPRRPGPAPHRALSVAASVSADAVGAEERITAARALQHRFFVSSARYPRPARPARPVHALEVEQSRDGARVVER